MAAPSTPSRSTPSPSTVRRRASCRTTTARQVVRCGVARSPTSSSPACPTWRCCCVGPRASTRRSRRRSFARSRGSRGSVGRTRPTSQDPSTPTCSDITCGASSTLTSPATLGRSSATWSAPWASRRGGVSFEASRSAHRQNFSSWRTRSYRRPQSRRIPTCSWRWSAGREP